MMRSALYAPHARGQTLPLGELKLFTKRDQLVKSLYGQTIPLGELKHYNVLVNLS